MPASTPKFAIPYPLPDDSVADYPGVGLDLAETLETLNGAPACRVRNVADQVCAANATTVLNFDTEEWDADGMHAAGAPSRLTIVKTGYYLAILTGIATATAPLGHYIRLRRNAGVEADHSLAFSAGYLQQRFAISFLFRCQVGDYLDAAIYIAGGAPTITYSGNGSHFGAAWLAP
jgi:hypothetical protein